MNSILVILFLFLIIIVNKFFNEKKYLPNYTGNKHQIFTNDKPIPLSGGFFLLLFLTISIFHLSYLLSLFLLLYYLIGFSGDTNFIKSPPLRLLIQLILSISFVYFMNLEITDVRVDFINIIIENKFISILFTSLCLVILINGSNFIDGINTLLVGYYSIIIFILFINFSDSLFFVYSNFYLHLILILFLLYFLNLKNKLYMGDSGAYILASFIGFILINLYLSLPYMSPYYIALLLWYPAFENFFSILRKYNFNRSPIYADNNHLHQLLFYYLYKKFKFNKLKSNNTSGNIINFYNLVSICIGNFFYTQTSILLLILIVNIVVYSFFYIKLIRYKVHSYK